MIPLPHQPGSRPVFEQYATCAELEAAIAARERVGWTFLFASRLDGQPIRAQYALRLLLDEKRS